MEYVSTVLHGISSNENMFERRTASLLELVAQIQSTLAESGEDQQLVIVFRGVDGLFTCTPGL